MKPISDTHKIIVVGVIPAEHGSGRIHQQDLVYSSQGVSHTLAYCDYKSPRMVLIEVDSCNKE